MEERMRFVARLLEGEQMAPLCRQFGISRKTGYKIFNRYKEYGAEALSDRSRSIAIRVPENTKMLPIEYSNAKRNGQFCATNG